MDKISKIMKEIDDACYDHWDSSASDICKIEGILSWEFYKPEEVKQISKLKFNWDMPSD